MHLLIIDDVEADHNITVEYLKETRGDYQFYHAYNAEQGLALYNKHHIDCVLLDYNMPDRDGLEVLKQLTEVDKTVPVIMITGEGNEFVAVTAMKLGSQDYIPKRILTPSCLNRAIGRAVEHAEIIRRMEKYHSDLERSNQDLEQFAHIVAHDLKSPLRAISQHLTLINIKNKDLLDEKSKQSLNFAVEGAERMSLLIEALFDYARIGFSTPNYAMVNLNELLENVKHDLSALIEERNVNITYDSLPEVYGDAILISQLFQNLIGNAIKYCKQTPHIHIAAAQAGEYWRIGVKDNGIGINPSQHKQIFTIFRRLHHPDEYPGIGLGLAICDRIIKLHGGTIGVDSEPGKGSCFYFTLPLKKKENDHG